MSSGDPSKDTDTAMPPPAEERLSDEDAAAIAAAMADESAVAKSLKCVDCGKLFKNADLANYHAEKSGHENFEESTEEVPSVVAPLAYIDQTVDRGGEKGQVGGLAAKDVGSQGRTSREGTAGCKG